MKIFKIFKKFKIRKKAQLEESLTPEAEDQVQEEMEESEENAPPNPNDRELVYGDLMLYGEGQNPSEEPLRVIPSERLLRDIGIAIEAEGMGSVWLLENTDDYELCLSLFKALYGDDIVNWKIDTKLVPLSS